MKDFLSKPWAFNFPISESSGMQSDSLGKSMGTAPAKNPLPSFSFHS